MRVARRVPRSEAREARRFDALIRFFRRFTSTMNRRPAQYHGRVKRARRPLTTKTSLGAHSLLNAASLRVELTSHSSPETSGASLD